MPAVMVPPMASMPCPRSESIERLIHAPMPLPAKAKRTLRTKGIEASSMSTPGFSIAAVPSLSDSTSGESSRPTIHPATNPAAVPRAVMSPWRKPGSSAPMRRTMTTMSTTVTADSPWCRRGGGQQPVAGLGAPLELGPLDHALLFSADAGEHAHPGGRQLARVSDHGPHLLLAAGEGRRPAATVLPSLPGPEHVDLGVGEPSGVRIVAEHVLGVHPLAAAQDQAEGDPGPGEDEAEDDEADPIDDLGEGPERGQRAVPEAVQHHAED